MCSFVGEFLFAFVSCVGRRIAPAERRWTCAGVAPRLRTNYQRAATQGDSDGAAFPSTAAAAAFALARSYCDVVHTCLPYATSAGALAPEEDAALLHAAQHLMTKMSKVKANNDAIEAGTVAAQEVPDQGLVRPTVLLLAPMRCVALPAVLRLLQLLQRASKCAPLTSLPAICSNWRCSARERTAACRADSIQGRQRFVDEFSVAKEEEKQREVQRPAEFKALFDGSNTNDHFRIGIRLTHGCVRPSPAHCRHTHGKGHVRGGYRVHVGEALCGLLQERHHRGVAARAADAARRQARGRCRLLVVHRGRAGAPR